MSDLIITGSAISAAMASLKDAAAPIADAVCIASSVVGSDTVRAALDDVEVVLRHVMDGLAEVSGVAASDAADVDASFAELDGRLSGDLP